MGKFQTILESFLLCIYLVGLKLVFAIVFQFIYTVNISSKVFSLNDSIGLQSREGPKIKVRTSNDGILKARNKEQ